MPRVVPRTLRIHLNSPIYIVLYCISDYVTELECVVSAKGGDGIDSGSYTYAISHGVATLIGEGDLHDRGLDEYGHSAGLIDMESAAPASYSYTLTIYPTRITFEHFYTYIPLAVSLSIAGVIGLCSFVFFIYDFFVKDEARRRKALLAMKKRFVRFVSHEIRTPLNTVSM